MGTFLRGRPRGILKNIDNIIVQSPVVESSINRGPGTCSLQVEMELAVTDEQRMSYIKNKPTWTAAYAIDRGVTLLFRRSFDATLRCTGLLLDEVFCNLAGGMFSSLSSSETSFAEDGEVNIVL